MKKTAVSLFAAVLFAVVSVGIPQGAKALSILDPGVAPIGCCSNLDYSATLGTWVISIPCLAFQGQYYGLDLTYNPNTGGFDIFNVYAGDGSCASGGSGGSTCSDCSCPTYALSHPSQCGATGDLNFRITWGDTNDVDLHVIYNGSEEIYFSNRTGSTTGGELDVDANADCNSDVTSSPVENIFYNNPPAGDYVFRVCGWTSCDSASSTVRAQVLVGGQVAWEDTITVNQWSNTCQDLVTFTVH